METEYGKVIAANRKRLGLTQAELGAELNVTAQAVSKWENGISEPDFATVQRLAELFGIGAEEFFGQKRADEQQTGTPEAAPAPAPATVAPPIIIGYCEACRKPIAQGQKYHIYPAHRGSAQRIVCLPCYNREEANRKRSEYNEERRTFRRSMIVATLVAVLVVLAGVITTVVTGDPVYLVSIAVAAALFLFVAQCFWTSYALELLLFFCRSFRLPGLIFSLDLDGILWFITVKLTLCILTGLLSALLFCIGLCVSMAVGIVTFPFCLPAELGKLRALRAAASQNQ